MPSLTPEEIEQIKTEYKDVFEEFVQPAEYKGLPHVIAEEPGSKPPYRRMYRMSQTELEVLKSEIAKLLAHGLIEPSNSKGKCSLCLPLSHSRSSSRLDGVAACSALLGAAAQREQQRSRRTRCVALCQPGCSLCGGTAALCACAWVCACTCSALFGPLWLYGYMASLPAARSLAAGGWSLWCSPRCRCRCGSR